MEKSVFPMGRENRAQTNTEASTPMHIIFFLADYAVVDRILDHLHLTFVVKRPPPPRIAYQDVLMAAQAGGEYFS